MGCSCLGSLDACIPIYPLCSAPRPQGCHLPLRHKAEKLGARGVLPSPEGAGEHIPETEAALDGEEQSYKGPGNSSAPSQLLQEGKLRPTKKRVTRLGSHS